MLILFSAPRLGGFWRHLLSAKGVGRDRLGFTRSLQRVAAIVGCVAVASLLVACSSSDAASSSSEGCTGSPNCYEGGSAGTLSTSSGGISPPAPDSGIAGYSNGHIPATNLCEIGCSIESTESCEPPLLPDWGVETSADAGVSKDLFACRPGSAQCSLAGTGLAGDSCASDASCSAGHLCVQDNTVEIDSSSESVGRCRRVCCSGVDACDASEACIGRKQANWGGSVPVCEPIRNCQLSSSVSCANSQFGCEQQECGLGDTCSVVSEMGETSCIPAGQGRNNDACPCQAGYFCSASSNSCVPMCELSKDECGDGKCQSVSNFPEGWGLCVAFSESSIE